MTQTEIQEQIIEKALKFYKKERFGYINIAQRVGKTRISCEILKKLYNFSASILLCYPDNKLQKQWTEELSKWNYINVNIIFCNFSSLFKYRNGVFDIILIDELHAASDNERDYCHQIMTNDANTRVLGLSGTVSKETQGKWGLKEIAKYSLNEAIDDKIIANYNITVHLVDLDNTIKTPNRKGKMLTEKQRYDNFTYVIQKMKEGGENSMHLALSRNRLSSSSVGKMKYLKQLLEKLKDKRVIVFTGLTEVADNTGIPSYHNKSKNDDNFQAFQREEINHLALAAMGKMGMSYNKLNAVILLNATYNSEETSQIAMRTVMLDFVDKIGEIHIIALKEKPEQKKIKESLSMLDQNKIKYVA